MGLALFLAIGLTWGAAPPTLEELAAAIERVRTGPDGERVVVGHISRKLAVSVETLRAQHAQTGLGWGELLIANLLLSKTTKLTVDQVTAELRSGKGWADIAHHHNVGLDQLIKDVQQSRQAMEQRVEDRAPPRSETLSSPGTTGPAPGAPAGTGPGRRY